MALPDFFKRKPADDAGPGRAARPLNAVDSAEKVRTRARQRLIGAVVLLTVGVIGFPLLFESQPRPIAVDIPIDIPKPDGVPALSLPAARPDSAGAPESAVASGVVTRDAPSEPLPSVHAEAEVPPASAAVAVPAVPNGSASTEATVSTAPVAAAAIKPPVAAEPASAAASVAERAPRFVVQVGAFTDPAAVRDVRAKMEKLGLKTYTQVADTTAGKRTRVRLGPFDSRGEADNVRARAKKIGVAAVVLTL